eukprot:3342960-Pyramimonas_sp.AAC.1
MSWDMLSARSARAISSLVACRHQQINLRRSRTCVACESPRSARNYVATSKRIQSEGVGLPADASVARCAVRLGTSPVGGLARCPGLAAQSPEPDLRGPAAQSPEPLL